MLSSINTLRMPAEEHSFTVTGVPALLIILVILAIFIAGIVSIFKWLNKKTKRR